MEVLILGGTRNLGPGLVAELLLRGHHVAVSNRGVTPDDLPPEVERLRADRRDREALARALGDRAFDGVVDTTLYTGPEAEGAVDLLAGRCGHYVALSTGQVYLVRKGLRPPFREEHYEGALLPEPPRDAADWNDWSYGVEKRAAEEVLARAVAERGFPATALRLPMVHGERDHYQRLHNYVARAADGGPLLIPEGAHRPIRHVDGADVVRVVADLLETASGMGGVYNLGQDETVPMDDFLALLARLVGRELAVARVPRERLVAEGLLPACSPFSGLWMSELDNRRSVEDLGVRYTPFEATLERLVRHYASLPPPRATRSARARSSWRAPSPEGRLRIVGDLRGRLRTGGRARLVAGEPPSGLRTTSALRC